MTSRPPTRTERTRRTILDGAREILAEGGVRALTVEGVAERTGIAKTTIYRRFRGKRDLALAVVLDRAEQVPTVPDRGSVADELAELTTNVVRVLTDALTGPVMQGLVSDLATDVELATAFRVQVVERRITDVHTILERAARRGEVAAELDAGFVTEMLLGPVYYRLLLSGEALDAAVAERIASCVVPGIATTGRAR